MFTRKNPNAHVALLAPGAKQMIRNLILRQDGTVLAGYRVGPARWDFTSAEAKAAQMSRDADVFAHLVGREYRQETSTRPHPVRQWAAQLDARTSNQTPDVHTCGMQMDRIDLLLGRCGCETWNTHLLRMQSAIAQTGMDDKVVFRYFSLNVKVGSRFDLHKELTAHLAGRKVPALMTAIITDEKRVHDIVSGWPGTRRMSEYEQAWLRTRRLAPGHQPTGVYSAERDGWDELALPALADNVRWTETPFGRTVKTNYWSDGVQAESHVRVLSVSRLSDLRYPENGLPPWQVLAESVLDSSGVPFAVEWSLAGRLLSGEQMSDTAELELRKAQFTQRDYRMHDETPPSVIGKGIDVALETRDQVTTGQGVESGRFLGQINVIITGVTPEQVEERCAAFIRMYSAGGLRMDFAGADSQSFYLQSTIPGEAIDQHGFQRRLRLSYLAAGMPNVTSVVGDSRGPYLGHTRGSSRRPVMHDPHYATEGLRTGRSANMHALISTLGGGKSVLMGSIAYNLARRGIRTIISDPSGPLARLCTMPEIAAVSQEINLLTGRKGILNPPSLIPNPAKEDFPDAGDWADAMEQTRAERRDLAVDMALRCLPEDLVADGSTNAVRTREALRLAAREHAETHSWETTSTLWDLVDNLLMANDAHASAVAGALVDASTAPLLRLLFPARGAGPVDGFSHYDKTLTVITTPGINRAVDGTLRRDWNPSEIGADAVLRLVALFTNRLVYSKTRHERAAVFFDEAETLTDFGPGRSMLSRLGRDHSKWNLAVYLGVKSINPQMLSGELKNFLASIFVGRMASAEPAQQVLDLLGLTDPRYVETLMNLSTTVPGEWVHLDVDGNIGGIRVDVDYHQRLKEILLTDPTPEGSQHWMLDEEMH